MNRAIAIFKKQLNDTVKNKPVLVQFIIFPVITYLFTELVAKADPGLPDAYFVTLFATMYAGMIPIVTIASVISEDIQNKSLRMLIMSNVKPHEYLLGVGSYIFLFCGIGSVAFGVIGGYTGSELLRFVLTMLSGIFSSTLLGSAIGIFSKNQGAATALAMPFSMITAFVPMIALFNDGFATFANILYTQQISYLLNDLSAANFLFSRFLIIGCNILIFIAVFIFAYNKKGLKEA